MLLALAVFKTQTITDLIEEASPNLLNTSFQSQYELSLNGTPEERAAMAFLYGIQNLFGLQQMRNTQLGHALIIQAHKLNSNEATIFLGNAHYYGKYGFSLSYSLAFNYFKEVTTSFVNNQTNTKSYQYNHNRYVIDDFIRTSEDKHIPRAERQKILLDVISKDTDVKLYGNILASGFLAGNFGFKEDEEMAARFALLGAADDLKIPMKEELNGYPAILRYLENQEDAPEPPSASNTKLGTWSKKVGKVSEEVQNVKIPQTLGEYFDDFTKDGINLLQFNNVLSFTDEAYFDAVIRLLKHVSGVIYKEYSYLEIFEALPFEPSNDQIFECLLASNSSLINEAALIFIEKTDHDPTLQNLRANLGLVNKGFEEYASNLDTRPKMVRSHKETCSRRGQNFGLISYFLSAGVLLPKEQKENVKKYQRLLSVASAYYGCHMGLTGLGLLEVTGFRPGYQSKPNLNAALMAFDIASQAGSFESSYYEALILSRMLKEFFVKDRNFMYAYDKASDLYHNVPKSQMLAEMLTNHAAHAGLAGGEMLRSFFEFAKDRQKGAYLMKEIATRIAVDDFVQDGYNSFVYGIIGEESSLERTMRSSPEHTICTSGRSGKVDCDVSIYYLFLELSHKVQNPQIRRLRVLLCETDVQVCINSQYGIDEAYLKNNEEKVFQFLSKTLQHNSYMADFLLVKLGDFQRDYGINKLNLATTHLMSVKTKYLKRVINNNDKLERELFTCFYDGITTLNQYHDCLKLDSFLTSLAGGYQKNAMSLSPYNSTVSEKSEHLIGKSVVWMNNFALDLLRRYKNIIFIDFVNLQESPGETDYESLLTIFNSWDIEDLPSAKRQNLLLKISQRSKGSQFNIKINGKLVQQTGMMSAEDYSPTYDFSELKDIITPQPYVKIFMHCYMALYTKRWHIIFSLLILITMYAIDRLLISWANKENQVVLEEDEDILAALDQLGNGFEDDVGK